MQKLNKRGLFIVIDGIDGVGKSTLIKQVSKKLKELRIKHKVYKEPLLQNGYKYIQYREQQADEIKQLLDYGYWVIADRYWGSTFAYNIEVSINYFLEKYNNGIKPDYEYIVENDLGFINKVLTARGEYELSVEKYHDLTQMFSMYAGLSNTDRLRTFTYSSKKTYNAIGRIVGDWLWK